MSAMRKRHLAVAMALTAAALSGATASAEASAQTSGPAAGAEVFARVGERVITLQEYQTALANGVRQKFYHGKPPEGELARYSREVGEKLIEQLLLVAEAERRGIEADRASVEKQVAEYDRRYATNEQWQRVRANVLPRLSAELERRSRLERLEAGVRAVPQPDESEARAYYAAQPAHFTEPEQVRLSLILLKVDPAAPRDVWDEARAEADRLHARLKGGAEFSELARAHSADPSAAKGGDLGYVHRGMLPEAIEKQFLDGLQPGAVSEPARVLEGFAIVRLEARKPARLREFADVAKNAVELLRRERGEQAWAKLRAQLRAAAAVQVDESRYLTSGTH